MWSWNNFLWPLLVINSLEMKTLPLGLAYFLGQYTIYWNLLMAGATIAMVPVLLIFFFAQRYFIEGITLTGLKGVESNIRCAWAHPRAVTYGTWIFAGLTGPIHGWIHPPQTQRSSLHAPTETEQLPDESASPYLQRSTAVLA